MSANERARRETLASGRAQVSVYIGGAKRNGIRVDGGVGVGSVLISELRSKERANPQKRPTVV